MVVRLEGTKDISCILEKFTGLGYDVVIQDKQIAFIYRKGSNSTNLRTDMKSAKDACKFVGTIKTIYGTSTSSL
jgi:hypothetical protein